MPKVQSLAMVMLATVALSSAALALQAFQQPGAEIVVPKLTPLAEKGKVTFDETCAACHGTNASGTDQGPPLVHRIYISSHHGDASFYRAVQMGSRAHHWNYGDMPPQPDVSTEQVAAIVRYVRELQMANGIPYQ